MSNVTRAGLGVALGCLTLVGHALAIGAAAVMFLRLPMEAGGLVLGPMLGLPLLAIALTAGSTGVALPFGFGRVQGTCAVCLVTVVDVMALLSGFRSPWLVAATAVSGAAAVLLVAALVPHDAR